MSLRIWLGQRSAGKQEELISIPKTHLKFRCAGGALGDRDRRQGALQLTGQLTWPDSGSPGLVINFVSQNQIDRDKDPWPPNTCSNRCMCTSHIHMYINMRAHTHTHRVGDTGSLNRT